MIYNLTARIPNTLMTLQTLGCFGAHLLEDGPIFIGDLMLERLQTRSCLHEFPADDFSVLRAANLDSSLEGVRCAAQCLVEHDVSIDEVTAIAESLPERSSRYQA